MADMAVPFQCACGSVRGEVEPRAAYGRVTCYCRDCQAFARTLGRAGDVLDEHGGTDIVAMQPAGLRFTEGEDHVVCLSLSPKGTLRWHSACCDMPIANTGRNPKLPYVGLLAAGISAAGADVDASFGRRRMVVNAGSAVGEVQSTRLRTALGVARVIAGVLAAKLRGGHRGNPFFAPDGTRPRAEPRILTREERAAATPGN